MIPKLLDPRHQTTRRGMQVTASQNYGTGQVILISGPIASGKTTLSLLLAERLGFHVVSTRELLAWETPDRRTLQAAGASLDDSTDGRWVLDALLRLRAQLPNATPVVVDAVRTLDQIQWVRNAIGASVVHVHLTAADEALSGRYLSKFEGYDYEQVKNDQVEQGVRPLASSANMVIDTTNDSPLSVLERLASILGLTA